MCLSIETETLFLETISIKNDKAVLLPWHLRRMQETQREIFGRAYLSELSLHCPFATNKKEQLKCRIIYDKEIKQIQFSAYTPKKIKQLRIVEAPQLDYHLKYAKRDMIDRLKEHCDEYTDIIITQQGRITDCSFANIVLFDGYNYITPQHYLLNGVQRQYLLKTGMVKSKEITITDLKHYKTLYLINAMLNWDSKIAIPITAIEGY